MRRIRIGIIGVGGYAANHLKSIQFCAERDVCKLTAAVIRNPNKANYRQIEEELQRQGVRIYRDYEEMFDKEQGQLDLISVPGGIDQHEEQSVKAMQHGYHVLCEKPVAGTIEEAIRMKQAAQKYRKILAIGYQQIFSPSIQKIKRLTITKRLGKLVRAKTWILWPRTSSYYQRNYWAGKLQVNGKFIYDSPLQNATAHFFNNMLYIAGNSHHESAQVKEVYGENYRAKEIECADTQYIKVMTAQDIPLYFYTSHAVQVERDMTEYHYEHGKIEWQLDNKTTVFEKQKKGTYRLIDEFDNGDISIRYRVFLNTIEAIQQSGLPLCNINNAIQHTLCVGKSFESSNGVVSVPDQYLERIPVPNPDVQGIRDDHNTVIKGIERVIWDMFKKEVGFSEYGCEWAKPSKVIKVNSM